MFEGVLLCKKYAEFKNQVSYGIFYLVRKVISGI